MRSVGPEVGLAGPERLAARGRKVMAGRVGVVVEEHRHAVGLGPPLPEFARGVDRDALLRGRAAERDERDDVERAEKGMHAVVPCDRHVCRDRVGEVARRDRRVVCARSCEREHRAVMVGVGVHVERANRRTERRPRQRRESRPSETFATHSNTMTRVRGVAIGDGPAGR